MKERRCGGEVEGVNEGENERLNERVKVCEWG